MTTYCNLFKPITSVHKDYKQMYLHKKFLIIIKECFAVVYELYILTSGKL